ncbi:hypothetical protein ACQEVF_58040 [Nonomuraea polychroma]|uniref:hypothetical protein n=1 Tax=Nonomuraea polychroma TaxID=46176 RepID=UPI003D92A694
MILRLWRWLIADVEHDLLRRAAADFAAELAKLSPGEDAELARRHQHLWWKAHRLAAHVVTSRPR